VSKQIFAPFLFEVMAVMVVVQVRRVFSMRFLIEIALGRSKIS